MKRSGWWLVTALALACNTSPQSPPLTDRDCPEGATVVGAAPPAGFLQRCELSGGVRHGKSRAWYDNGRPRYETEWWQGSKHGKFTLWYPNGQKRAEGEDRHGAAIGKWIAWAEDGTVVDERVFEAPEREVAEQSTIRVHAPAVSGPSRPGSRDRDPEPVAP